MLDPTERIVSIDYEQDIETVVVRTENETNFEDKLRQKTLTSGCAQGTVFGDLMEKFETIVLAPEAELRTSWLYTLTKKINTAPAYTFMQELFMDVSYARRTGRWSIWRMWTAQCDR